VSSLPLFLHVKTDFVCERPPEFVGAAAIIPKARDTTLEARAQCMAMTVREDVWIPSHAEQLAAYVYRPDSDTGNSPCVVMAHGWSATRDDGLPGFAEAFRGAGFVVILFDYRHFGASTGEPRQLLDIRGQHDDYRAVVAWARELAGVDPDRVVLFGSSFSGGHVLAVAATDARIAAVISQAPFTDAIPTLMLVPPRNIVRFVVAAVRDQAGAWLGRSPVLVPAVGEPGAFGAMTAPEAKPGFDAIVPSDSKWRNEFAARMMLAFPFYRPGRKAAKLKMPVLICICDTDETTPIAPALRAAKRALRAELRRYPYGHFGIYHDPQAKADQVAFLRRTVQGVAAPGHESPPPP
jgi:pimeloyl-ACP methyl ester carboxylesterase